MSNPSRIELLSDCVQECLQNIIKRLNIKISSINAFKREDYGENHLGVIIHVQIIDTQGKKIDIVVKSGPKSLLYRSFFPIKSVYLRESYVYSTVLQEFTKFQADKSIKDTFGYFPKFYGSVAEEEKEAIFLENVKELDYINLKHEDTLNYIHALLVAKELGKLHAISFAMKDQRRLIFDELSQNMDDSYFLHFESNDDVITCFKNWGLAARNSLDQSKDKVLYNTMETFKDKWYQTVCGTISPQLCKEHAVICHGDVWVGNLLFKYSVTGLPERVCFLDWQIARYGSPVLDLLQFLFTCTNKSLRDDHYNDLVDAYYDSLCEFLLHLGSDPKILFPIDIFQHHLQKFSPFGLCMGMQVTWLTLNISKDQHFDIDVATDEDVEKVVDQYNRQNTKKYNSRMRDIILDYFSLGYKV